jgi:hypothetical protein
VNLSLYVRTAVGKPAREDLTLQMAVGDWDRQLLVIDDGTLDAGGWLDVSLAVRLFQ